MLQSRIGILDWDIFEEVDIMGIEGTLYEVVLGKSYGET